MQDCSLCTENNQQLQNVQHELLAIKFMLNAVECEKRELVAKLDNVSRENDAVRVQDENLEIETDLQQTKKENSDLR